MKAYLKFASVALLCSMVYLAAGAQYSFAQIDDADPFGEREDAAPAPKDTTINPAQSALFGAVDGSGNRPTIKLEESWGNLNELGGGDRIEDNYEMKMREELDKPLPDHNPFGNRMEDLRKPPKDPKEKPLF